MPVPVPVPRAVPRAVLVDLYGTLVEDDDAVVARICADVAARSGAPVADVEAAWTTHLWAGGDAHGDAFRALADLTRSTLGHLAEAFGVAVDVDAWLTTSRAAWRAPRLLPDARAFLGAIDAMNMPVCLVSDVDRDDAAAVLAHHALHVDAVVTSEDARAYKPRPEPFLLALERLGVAPADAVHVGDSPAADVAGAHALGIAAVLVDRAGRARPEAHGAAHVVRSLAAVPVEVLRPSGRERPAGA